jgi:hypothetical protein
VDDAALLDGELTKAQGRAATVLEVLAQLMQQQPALAQELERIAWHAESVAAC